MYVVGIDLGTTNSALAHADLERPASVIQLNQIDQLVAPGEAAARPTLPSFRYLAGQHELASGALRLPWDDTTVSPDRAVGELARVQGAQVPGRLVASAKSWLCHPRVDRLKAILPWGEAPSS